ncbi:MAG: hypothetical protein ACI4DY_06860 [Monoglobaceae bacterium]
MDNYELTYHSALQQVEQSVSAVLQEWPIPCETDINNAAKSESMLDAWDYCYAIAIGMAGVLISTKESFGQYLDQIHKAASGAGGDYDIFQSFLGDMLCHKGDHIDAIEMPFKNRNGGNAYCIFHRLLWGHDILSIKGDNPYALMFEQKGLSGILQAVRHLLADTMSKQGLPLPGSSFLDVVDENNKTSNYLIQIAQQLAEETTGAKAGAQEIYSHMMTIRAQDVSAGVVVKLVTDLYFCIRKVEDNIRRSQIYLIAYAVNFLGEAVVGCFRQNGVPYINIPLAGAMATSFTQFCYYNNKENKKLSAETDGVHSDVEALEAKVCQSVQALPVAESAEALFKVADTAENNVVDLVFFFGEDTQ